MQKGKDWIRSHNSYSKFHIQSNDCRIPLFSDWTCLCVWKGCSQKMYDNTLFLLLYEAVCPLLELLIHISAIINWALCFDDKTHALCKHHYIHDLYSASGLKGGQKEVSANTKKLPESYSTSIFCFHTSLAELVLILVFAATEQHLKGILPVEVLKYSSSTLQQDATMSVFHSYRNRAWSSCVSFC